MCLDVNEPLLKRCHKRCSWTLSKHVSIWTINFHHRPVHFKPFPCIEVSLHIRAKSRTSPRAEISHIHAKSWQLLGWLWSHRNEHRLPISSQASFRVISLSLEATRLGVLMIESLWKFDRHLGSAAAEVHVKLQSDWRSLNPNLAASRLHEILR